MAKEPSQCRFIPGTLRQCSFDYKAESREVLLYAPSKRTSRVPLVFCLHGGGGTPFTASRQMKMEDTAEKYGFMAVYPTSGKKGCWNVGLRNDKRRQSHADDVGFISYLIDWLVKNAGVDKNRVYVTGLSNGAMMSYQLACSLSEKIAAIAPVGGAMMNRNLCSRENPVAVFHVHGVEDKLVPYTGGSTQSVFLKMAGVSDDFSSLSDSMKFWKSANGCNEKNPPVLSDDGQCHFCHGDSGYDVKWCLLKEHGHSWPGGIYLLEHQWWKKMVGPISDYPLNEKIWEFFTQYKK
jgi:polyhydroxybutyrate depolymerase